MVILFTHAYIIRNTEHQLRINCVWQWQTYSRIYYGRWCIVFTFSRQGSYI